MNTSRGLTLIEVALIVVVLAILAALAAPLLLRRTSHVSTEMQCAGNLRQIYTLATIYSSTHGGKWPEATGSDLWFMVTQGRPPLLDDTERDSLFSCPCVGEIRPVGESHYRGPSRPYSQLALKDVLAADLPGNHGDSSGGNVLLKDGSVLEVEKKDPLWKECEKSLKP